MENTNKILYEKWVIIPVNVAANGVSGIDCKMPCNARECAGVAFTIPEIQGNFFPSKSLGEVSLLFNNRRSHPIHFQTEYRTFNFRLDSIILKLEEQLTSSSRVSGYYRNYLDTPHVLNIYLQCIAEEMM